MDLDDEERGSPLRPVHDLSGVPALDVEGEDAGEVFGALAEADTGLIRYLDLQVARSERHVLVPIGHARVEEGPIGTRVQLRAATREDLGEIPAFDSDFEVFDDEFHRAVLAAFGRFLYGERYYAHPAYDHSGLYAGEHPIVRPGEGVDRAAAFEAGAPLPLAELPGYEVADGEPDIRGWPLATEDGRATATISDLLVDPEAESVRYVSVTLPDEDLPRLVPVGYLEVEREHRSVRIAALDQSELARLPGHAGGPVDRDKEEQVRAAIADILSGPRRYARADFTSRPGFTPTHQR